MLGAEYVADADILGIQGFEDVKAPCFTSFEAVLSSDTRVWMIAIEADVGDEAANAEGI